MRWLACVNRSKLPSPVLTSAVLPLSVGSRVGDVELVSLGMLWGVAVVVWGACAILVALAALLRNPPTDEAGQVGRLHTRIRRYRLASSSRSPQA
jgi:hypothetical protein